MPTIDANNLSDEFSLEDNVGEDQRRVKLVFPTAIPIGIIRSADLFNAFHKDSNADALLLNLYQRLVRACSDPQLPNNAEWLGSQIITILSSEVHRVKLDKATKVPPAVTMANQRIKDLLYDVGHSSTHREIPCSMPSAQHTIQLHSGFAPFRQRCKCKRELDH